MHHLVLLHGMGEMDIEQRFCGPLERFFTAGSPIALFLLRKTHLMLNVGALAKNPIGIHQPAGKWTNFWSKQNETERFSQTGGCRGTGCRSADAEEQESVHEPIE